MIRMNLLFQSFYWTSKTDSYIFLRANKKILMRAFRIESPAIAHAPLREKHFISRNYNFVAKALGRFPSRKHMEKVWL